MTKPKPKEPKALAGMTLDEALARLLQTNPKELEDMYDETRRSEEQAKRFIEEREQSIRRGAHGVRRRRNP